MQFEYDPEKLIEEVKKRPGIWDYESVSYRTVTTRLELWNEVVRELLQPNVKITKSETRELVLQLQKKWKSLKDSFQKYSHNPSRTKRPYIYSKHLQFLMKNGVPGTEKEGTSVDVSSESEEEPKKKRPTNIKLKKRIKLKKKEPSDDERPHEAYVEVPRMRPVDEFAFVDSNSEGDDCDRMFLLSLLSPLKSIPEASRLHVKMELLQVLRNATCNR